MIKIEETQVCGMEAAIRGMRNPKRSWYKSDSTFNGTNSSGYDVGPNDLNLMKRLVLAGNDHSKFMRMINVYCDITAPTYFVQELDTYKIGTVRNSCSFQHTGTTEPFNINQFSVNDERIYEILDPKKIKREHPRVILECGDDEFRIYECGDRKYRVYKNSRVVSEEFTHFYNNMDHTFKEREMIPTQTPCGYYELNLGGRMYHEKWLLHRLVAEVWMKDSYFDGAEINHKDGNKGNNDLSNLEWVTHSENELHKHRNGLSGNTIRTDYLRWKNGLVISVYDRYQIKKQYDAGSTYAELKEKYGVSTSSIYAALHDIYCENDDLFRMANQYESLLEILNELRDRYIDTNDYNCFREIRQLLPMGYNYQFTWMANYAVLRNIYHSRKNHALTEWHEFCDWIESLPYSELITIKRNKNE